MSAADILVVQDAALISIVEKLRDQGSWTGQTHVQKALYFCQGMLRLPLGFDFILYKHGPYSPTLHRSIHRLQADSALAFVPQTPPYRPRLVTSEGAELIRETEPDVLAAYDDGLEFAAAALGRKTIAELERLATALWFMLRRPEANADDIAALVHGRKPHVSLEEATRAFREVKHYGRIARERGLIESSRPNAQRARRRLLPEAIQPALVIDLASSRRLGDGELAAWAQERSVFISSEMSTLKEHRDSLARALRGIDARVIMFEDLGGLDDDARRAYLAGVAQADVYVGIVAQEYGTVLPDGRSATHEEYLQARREGKRITFWVSSDGECRAQKARDFVDEVRAFHTTGRFSDASDLGRRPSRRGRHPARRLLCR